MIAVVFILIWLITNRIAKILWCKDEEGFKYIQKWYYWFQFCLFSVSILLTPKFSVNESLLLLIIFISLKIIIDRIKLFDVLLGRLLDK